jgi:hypothetical protein
MVPLKSEVLIITAAVHPALFVVVVVILGLVIKIILVWFRKPFWHFRISLSGYPIKC